uniref:Uncharacterized protein n=1 Tax=Pristionchus pacificus TaxID=54126 RepID=A0A2A6CWI6_PRIPA
IISTALIGLWALKLNVRRRLTSGEAAPKGGGEHSAPSSSCAGALGAPPDALMAPEAPEAPPGARCTPAAGRPAAKSSNGGSFVAADPKKRRKEEQGAE